MTRFLFITVAAATAASLRDLAMLLESIGRQNVEAEMILVLRGGTESPVAVPSNLSLHVLGQPLVVSLSRARNIALSYACECRLLDDAHVIAFPDDDCSYPDDALAHVSAALSSGCHIVSGAYRPKDGQVDTSRFPDAALPLTPRLVTRCASSGTCFILPDVVGKVGLFDERFGLGARYGASEDTDYIIRALRSGVRGQYDPEILVHHPYKEHRPAQYYVGNIAVLAKHAHTGALLPSLLHRLLVGALWTVKGWLPPREFIRAIRAALTLSARRAPHARS